MNRLLPWLDDHIHPIVLKELRQATQGRFLSGMLLTLVLAQLGAVGLFLFNSDLDSAAVLSQGGYGGTIFTILVVLLLLLGGLCLPVYANIRFAVERAGEGLALLFISDLTPGRIIGGKIISNLVLAALMMCLCLPYMAFTYFLRGIDLLTMGQALVVVATSIVCAVVVAIFVAAVPWRGLSRILLMVGGLIGLIWWFFWSTALVVATIEGARWSRTMTEGWWLLAPLTACLAVLGLIYLMSVAMISPSVSNRAKAVRLYICVLWLICGLLATWLWHQLGWEDMVWIWLSGAMVVYCGALLVATVAPDTISRRLRGEVAAKPLRRVVDFLLASGSGNGILWALLMLVATLTWIAMAQLGPTSSRYGSLWKVAGAAAFVLAYCLLAIRWQRAGWASRVQRQHTWLLATLLILLASLVPPMLFFLLSIGAADPWLVDSAWGLLSPLGVVDDMLGDLTAGLGVLFALLMMRWQLPWLRRQVVGFRPPAVTSADDGAADGGSDGGEPNRVKSRMHPSIGEDAAP